VTYRFDVLIAGSGNAGLCSALAAHEAGARVLLVDWAPESRFGGNSFYTGGGIRLAHAGTADILELVPHAGLTTEDISIEPYSEADFYADLLTVTEFRADPVLAETLIAASRDTVEWMRDNRVKFELRFAKQSKRVAGKTVFFGRLILEAYDGGQGLVTGLLRTARERGIEVMFGTRLVGAGLDESGAVSRARLRSGTRTLDIDVPALVLACGGFEANAAMRAQYLGKDWDLARPRGTEFNQGDGHRIAASLGAGMAGHWTGCHAVQWDVNAPAIRDRRMAHGYERESYPLGIIVNQAGQRFLDEGADFFPLTYAKYGKEVLAQPGALAFQVFDGKVADMLLPDYSLKATTRFRRDSLKD
jgi:tricarballylate dehydrogenase